MWLIEPLNLVFLHTVSGTIIFVDRTSGKLFDNRNVGGVRKDRSQERSSIDLRCTKNVHVDEIPLIMRKNTCRTYVNGAKTSLLVSKDTHARPVVAADEGYGFVSSLAKV